MTTEWDQTRPDHTTQPNTVTMIQFLVGIVIAFFVLRWFVSSQKQPTQGQGRASGSRSTPVPPGQPATHYRRPVTQSMIDVVQALGPNLTPEQIRYDLERTGSVETTVNRFLEHGDLPHPPHASGLVPEIRVTSASSTSINKMASTSTNLVSKYDVDVNQDVDLEKPMEKPQWSQSREERQKQLRRQQQDMILRARKKLEQKKDN
ncbi:hypothetical protein TRVA0_008S02630 [Trichomonascus vanleenenianus]|uniref:Cue1p n=1 Tax=Trichomonascus vanleenenianus TaxID=2268995 RepID=UPI003ECACA79